MSAEPGKGLTYWRKQLAQARLPLVADDATLERMLDPEVSLDWLQARCEHEPGLSFVLLTEVAKVPRVGGKLQGLTHALTVLGTNKVRDIITRFSEHRLQPDNPAHRALLQTHHVAQFAAQLVHRWVSPGSSVNLEWQYWITRLLSHARCRLVLADPDAHAEIEARCRAGERRHRVEQDVLGIDMERLNSTVLADAGFPEDAIRDCTPSFLAQRFADAWLLGWTSRMAPERPVPFERWLREIDTVCMFAHLIAWSAHDSWYGRRTIDLLEGLTTLLRQPFSIVTRDIHQAAVETSRTTLYPGLINTMGEALFWPPPPPRSLARPKKPAVSGSAAAATPASAPAPGKTSASGRLRRHPTEPNSDIVEAFVKACIGGQFPDLRHFISETGHTLQYGLGLDRCLLFLNTSGDTAEHLLCYFAYGFEDVITRGAQLPINDGNLLARLYAQPGGALWISAEKVRPARLQLPELLKPCLLSSGAAVGSLTLGNRSVGLLWADAGDQESPLDGRHYRAFRHMIEHFGTEFSRLTMAMKR